MVKYRGVIFDKWNKAFKANICVNGQRFCICTNVDAKLCADAYDVARIYLRGENSVLHLNLCRLSPQERTDQSRVTRHIRTYLRSFMNVCERGDDPDTPQFDCKKGIDGPVAAMARRLKTRLLYIQALLGSKEAKQTLAQRVQWLEARVNKLENKT